MRVRRWLVVWLLSGPSCGEQGPPPEELKLRDACDGLADGIVCRDGLALRCEAGDVAERDRCEDRGMTCRPERGCELCRPQYYECEGNRLHVCSDDGRELKFVQDCGDKQCSPRGCRDLCADAREERSYIGCEYWPVFTLNSQLDDVFQPAVVVGNSNLVEAQVRLTKLDPDTREERLVAEAQVAPGATATLEVELSSEDILRHSTTTSLVPAGAYRLVSSVPVMAHQFNPLLFEVDRACEAAPKPDGGLGQAHCYSYTNDASLLLPSHVLARPDDGGITYLGLSRATFMARRTDHWFGGSGFLALLALGERPVQVTLESSAYTLPSVDGFPALAPGDSYTFSLEPGSVLQLLSELPAECPGQLGHSGVEEVCDPGPDYDLTGTLIRADGPLQVIGGHDCTFVPFDTYACDHLEETLFPLHTWGQRVIVVAPNESRNLNLIGGRKRAPYFLRVVSGVDDNAIRFVPELAAPVRLSRGQWYEFELDQDVVVEGTGPLAVAQYLLGQEALMAPGDPSFTLVPPVEQYRAHYTFLSPATYLSSYVTIVAPRGESVVLDGDSVTDFEPIGDTGYASATVQLDVAGDHELYSQRGVPIGIMLYGYGRYTSYMLPGGLDLQVITDLF
jgi:hypothetical protein